MTDYIVAQRVQIANRRFVQDLNSKYYVIDLKNQKLIKRVRILKRTLLNKLDIVYRKRYF